MRENPKEPFYAAGQLCSRTAFKTLYLYRAMRVKSGRVLCGKFTPIPQKSLRVTLTSVRLPAQGELRVLHARVSRQKRSAVL